MIKKKIITLALCSAMCMSTVMPVSAAEVSVGDPVETVTEVATTTDAVDDLTESAEQVEATSAADFEWSGTVIKKYTGTAKTVTIPSNCTELYSSAFSTNQDIENVIIGSGVTKIGSYCFSGCENLKSVSIPNSVTTIGQCAFGGCFSLEQVNIPENLGQLQRGLFENCKSLKTVTIPATVTDFGKPFSASEEVFSGCESLTKVNIPDGVTAIGKNFFHGCESLKEITLPQSVTYLGQQAFYECKALTKVNIPATIESLPDGLFYGCEALEQIALPSTLTEINSSVFWNCKNLKTVAIPSGVTNIGASAFAGCEALTSVTIPSNVTSVRYNTFSGCTALQSVKLSQNITKIDQSAFYGCESLTNLAIPSGVNEIGSYAFAGCAQLSGITIPTGVSKIESFTFQNCSSLSSITIPDNITAIGSYAFSGCNSLASLVIPTSVKQIDALWYNNDADQGATMLYVYKDSYAHSWAKTQAGMRYQVKELGSSPVQNLKAAANGKQRVKLTWTKVSGANGYFVFAKKNGQLQFLGDTNNTYYDDSAALVSENNFYWVYPYVTDGQAKRAIGGCPNAVYAKGVCAPVTNLKAESAGKNEVKLTWSASSGAQGYIIYAKKNTEKAVYLGMTSNTRYTDKKALSTAYNFYFVYPYTMDANGKRVLGAAPKYVYAKGICKAVTNLKVASVKGGVKVTFTKSAGAAGYYVYKKVGKGAFTYIGYTTGNTYTDKKASKTQYNFYRVVPYHKEGTKKVMGQLGTYVYGKAK